MQFTHLRDQLRFARLNLGIVSFPTDIDPISMQEFIDEFDYAIRLPFPSVILEILSNGGDCYSAFGAYDVIRDCPKPVEGHVLGCAASAAAMIVLQACSARISTRNARFLIHEIQLHHFFDIEKVSGAEDNTKELVTIQNRVLEILAGRTGRSVEEWKEAINRREFWLYAEEALEWGLIDEIRGTI